MTPHLADLLRKIAEKMPEKVYVEEWNGEMSGEAVLLGLFINGTWEEYDITAIAEAHYQILDLLDAIAEAVGMRFTVIMDSAGQYVGTWFRKDEHRGWVLVDSSAWVDSKRPASIAALIACLEYTLGKERK
jgi:hypothetical protein